MGRLSRDRLDQLVPLARHELIEVAKRGPNHTITYRSLQCAIGTGRGHIGQVLVALSEQDSAKGNPMLAALVVHAYDGEPGEGFWGPPFVPASARSKEAMGFWEAECQRVWRHAWGAD